MCMENECEKEVQTRKIETIIRLFETWKRSRIGYAPSIRRSCESVTMYSQQRCFCVQMMLLRCSNKTQRARTDFSSLTIFYWYHHQLERRHIFIQTLSISIDNVQNMNPRILLIHHVSRLSNHKTWARPEGQFQNQIDLRLSFQIHEMPTITTTKSRVDATPLRIDLQSWRSEAN